jgi:glycosyltransferase involved in cell wall biosynthesis
MHVLMLSLDTSILTQQIGNSRARHEFYAQQVGRISMVVCNRRRQGRQMAYVSARVNAQPTNSRSYLHYVLDGYRTAVKLVAQHADQPISLITAQEPFVTALVGLALRRRLNVPLIIQDHSSFLESQHFAAETPRNRVLRWIAMQTMPRADAVRVVNWQEKAGAVRLGLPAGRMCVIPLVPSLAPFAATTHAEASAGWRVAFGLSAETPLILWVGRPVTFKNLPMLLQAFASVRAAIPDAVLVLAGDMARTDIPARIAAAGLTEAVRLPGAVPHADLPALYQAATVYALSSNYEGLPGVLLEASAAALPIVSTANNGSKDLIRDGVTGLLTPIGDAKAMSEALIALLHDPARRAQMGAAARQHVLESFDENRLLMQWVEMWRSVAVGKPPCDY